MSGTENRARLLPLPWRGVKTFSISPILLLPLFSFLCRTWLKVGSDCRRRRWKNIFSRISSWTRAARMQRADDYRHSRGGRLEFLFFFCRIRKFTLRGIQCKAQHQLQIDKCHAPTIALQYSAIQKVQGHHYAQEKGFFY